MKEIKNNIISKFGGVGIVAHICGVTASAVSQWVIIPARHHIKLLEAARRMHIPFESKNFHEEPKIRKTIIK